MIHNQFNRAIGFNGGTLNLIPRTQSLRRNQAAVRSLADEMENHKRG